MEATMFFFCGLTNLTDLCVERISFPYLRLTAPRMNNNILSSLILK